ncbi:MAG TPA: hypothetical protein VIY50_15255 [Steroidobacteraceae bacterium]
MATRRDAIRYLGLASALPLLAGEPRSAAASTRRSADRTIVIPFTLAGRAGRIAVTYGPIEDPIAAGFDVIPGLPFDVALCRGYPNVHAIIEAFGGSGYRGLCGWIQVVTGKRYRIGSEEADTAINLDKLPSIADVNMPFAVFGYLPEWFDAPCRNLNGYERLHWTADTFLTTVPLRSRNGAIERLAGFRWGYVEYAPAAQHAVSVLPLDVTGASAWNGLLPFLRKASPGWRFAAA